MAKWRSGKLLRQKANVNKSYLKIGDSLTGNYTEWKEPPGIVRHNVWRKES